jgi:hypothetical protein
MSKRNHYDRHFDDGFDAFDAETSDTDFDNEANLIIERRHVIKDINNESWHNGEYYEHRND